MYWSLKIEHRDKGKVEKGEEGGTWGAGWGERVD